VSKTEGRVAFREFERRAERVADSQPEQAAQAAVRSCIVAH
jgi:hypothetical protein